jgi:peptide-methionine (S)-S-oxide reductase
LPRIATSKSHVSAIKEGTFGMGCFWEPAEELLKVDGVVSTSAGYTGNPTATKAPNYDSVCFSRDWVEGVRVQYDDEKITYEQLLDAFYESQKPKLGSRQYSSIIFAHDDEQQQISSNYIQSNAKAERSDGWMTEWTTIEPLTKFYQAEGYHQNYWQKQRPRFAAIIGLLAVATGVLDPIVPLDFQKTVETGANAAALAIGLYQILERVLDAKVVEL